MLLLLAILWLLSPVVLFVLYMMASGRDKVREKENRRLIEGILRLYRNGVISDLEYYEIIRKSPPTERDLKNRESAGQRQAETLAGTYETAALAAIAGPENSYPHQAKDRGTAAGNTAGRETSEIPVQKGSAPANLILILGVLFVTMAGLIFATTTWQLLPNVFRMVIVFSQSGLFFGVSFISQYKLKLKHTGMAFYILGCLFLPLGIVAAGFFQLLGPEFSFLGRDCYLVSLAAFLLLALSLGGGTYFYRRKSFLYSFLGCIFMVIASLAMHIRPEGGSLALVLTLYGTIFYLTAMIGTDRTAPVKSFARGQVLSCALLTTLISFGTGAFFRPGGSLPLVVAVVLLYALMTHIGVKEGGVLGCLHPVLLQMVFWGGITLFSPEPGNGPRLISILSFAAFFLYYYSERVIGIRLQTFVSDSLFLAGTILPGLFIFSQAPGFRLLAMILALVILVLVSLERKRLCYLLPHLGMLCFIPVWEMTGGTVYQICQIAFLLIAATGIGVHIVKSSAFTRALSASLDVAIAFYGVLFALLVSGSGFISLEMAGLQSVIYWISFGYWSLRLLLSRDKLKYQAFTGAAVSGVLGLLFSSYDVLPGLAFGWRIYTLVLAGIILCCLMRLEKVKTDEDMVSRIMVFATLLFYGTSILTILFFVFMKVEPYIAYGVASIGLALIVSSMLQQNRRLTFLGFIPAGGIFFVAKGILWHSIFSGSTVWGYLALFLLLGASGRGFFGRNRHGLPDQRRYQGIDWLTIWAGAAIPGLFLKQEFFLSCLLLSVYSLLFYNRLNHPRGNQLALSGGLLGAVLGMCSKASIITVGLRTTWIFTALLLGVFLAHYFVWKKGQRSGNLLFGTAILAAAFLLAEAVGMGAVGNAMLLGTAAIALLLLACRIRSKRWFLFAAITLVIIGLYVSWGFWISLAWWIYLLVAGVLLIISGARYESARTRGKDVKNTIREFFDGWTM